MAMLVQTNRNSSTVPMDSYKQLPQSTEQEDSFHRIILEKIEEGKQYRDPIKCQQILNDLMTMLKHLTADINNYNLAFRETRPSFYVQVRYLLISFSFDLFVNDLFVGISTSHRPNRNINEST